MGRSGWRMDGAATLPASQAVKDCGEGCFVLARRVLLVDDHPVFRTGLRRVLEATGRYEIVGEAGNAHEAIRAAEETRPGLILLDVQLPGITGLRITRILRRKQTRARIVVVSVHMDDDRIIEAVGVDPIVFGTDFPHGEGLPDPSLYLGQLTNLSAADAKAVMRDNLGRFLDKPAG